MGTNNSDSLTVSETEYNSLTGNENRVWRFVWKRYAAPLERTRMTGTRDQRLQDALQREQQERNGTDNAVLLAG